MYCSEFCLNESKQIAESQVEMKGYHILNVVKKALYMSGGYEELHTVFADSAKQTIFDYDLSDRNNSDTKFGMIKCVAALKEHPTQPNSSHFVEEILKFNLPNRKTEIILEFYRRIDLIGKLNGIKAKDICLGIPLFTSLLNRSCDPNIDTITVDGRFMLVVNRPVKKGEQLFILSK